MRTPSFAVASVVTFALSAAPALAGLTIQTGLANMAIFGPGFDPTFPTFLRSEYFDTSTGPIGPVTLTRPGVGVPYTRLSLTDFTASGFSLVESGTANMNWSAWVAFAFTPTVDMYLNVSGQLFGNTSGLNTFVEVINPNEGDPIEIFGATTVGSFASSSPLTLLAGVQYTVEYQSNFGASGGGSGNGTLLNFSLTPVPAPGAIALIAMAGLATTRRRRG